MNHTGTIPLETQRLILRRFRPEDTQAAYANFMSDPEVPRFMRWEAHTDITQTEEYLAQVAVGYEKTDYYRWAITLKPDDGPIGVIAMMIGNERDATAEVAYALGRQYWNMGIVSEALARVLAHAFGEVGVNRLEAYHSVRNPASGKVMQKAGMRCEGHARQKYKGHDGYEDCDLYAILAEDWNKDAR